MEWLTQANRRAMTVSPEEERPEPAAWPSTGHLEGSDSSEASTTCAEEDLWMDEVRTATTAVTAAAAPWTGHCMREAQERDPDTSRVTAESQDVWSMVTREN